VAAVIYVSGLIALVLPIRRGYITDWSTAFYATSFVPKIAVAGYGAGSFILPAILVLIVLIYYNRQSDKTRSPRNFPKGFVLISYNSKSDETGSPGNLRTGLAIVAAVIAAAYGLFGISQFYFIFHFSLEHPLSSSFSKPSEVLKYFADLKMYSLPKWFIGIGFVLGVLLATCAAYFAGKPLHEGFEPRSGTFSLPTITEPNKAIAGIFLLSLAVVFTVVPYAALKPLTLPGIEIVRHDMKLQVEGHLLGHLDTYWYVMPYRSRDDSTKSLPPIVAVSDDQVKNVCIWDLGNGNWGNEEKDCPSTATAPTPEQPVNNAR
jgi:hypothetical protein